MSKPKFSKASSASEPAAVKTVASSAQKLTPTVPTFENLRDRIEAQLQTSGKQKSPQVKKNVPSKPNTHLRGKKRNATGVIISNGNLPDDRSNEVVNEDDDPGTLHTLIQELGGTNEDFDLITNAVSDSEVEGSDSPKQNPEPRKQKKGKALEVGISNILKEIALAQTSSKDTESVSEEDLAQEAQQPQAVSHLPATRNETEIPTKKDTRKRKTDLKCEPRPDWFTFEAPVLDARSSAEHTISSRSIDQLRTHAHSLLQAENEVFRKTQEMSSSQAFYNTVIASGTLTDKTSALTLAVQESPLHNMKALEALIGLARKRSRAQAVDVLRALKDLFAQGSLLPGDRKLHFFASQPRLLAALGGTKQWNEGDKLPKGIDDRLLIFWAFESWLKEQYFEVLKILEVWCNDEIEFSKSRAVSYVYELLKEKPEQESNLLRLLVNKLGDPVKKIASQASYLIMQLLIAHPAMKEIVISTMESDFIFRPGQSMHSKYYAVVTINQTALSTNEEAVATKLLEIYFGLFKTLLKPTREEKTEQATQITSQSRNQRQKKGKKGPDSNEIQGEELREKLISAILTGVNRAHPYISKDHQSFSEHVETLFQITHATNFNTSVQALMLIQQLTSAIQSSSDRFYRTLYESLLDARLITSSKQQMYLNLLHKSLKADLNMKRVKAFVKRILQILSLHEAPFICGAYFLLKDLEKTFPALTAMLDQPEEKEDDEEVFRDVDEDAAPSSKPPEPHSTLNTGLSYDGSKRAPEHAHADNSCAWELLPFLAHFHPSVAVSADRLLEHASLPGKPDLSLHTMIHFLDRFVYKNPKFSSVKLRGSSIMQPMASNDLRAVLLSTPAAGRRLPVNSEEFRNKKNEDVAAEDVFFHKYFQTLGKPKSKGADKPHRDRDEDVSLGSDDEDDVWKAMVESAPDLEGLDEDDDIDMSDMSEFEAAMDEEGESLDENADENEEDVDVEAGIFGESDTSMGVDDEQPDLESGSEAEFDGLESGEDQDEDDAEEDKKPPSKATQRNKEARERKKKFKALPTFASASDYAQMLDDDEDEDLG